MKKIVWPLMLGIFLVASGIAGAGVITFDDSTIYWDSWGNGNDDSRDSIGSPDFPDINAGKLTISTTGNYLESVSIFYNRYSSVVWMGDLFIDNDGDSNWDFVLDPNKDTNSVSVYKVVGTYSSNKSDYTYDGSYTYTNSQGYGYNTSDKYFGSWDPASYREDHPVEAINLTTDLFENLGTGTYTPYNADTTTPVVFAGLGGFGIDISSDTIIAIAPNCANDVIRERVPEPSTMLLFGVTLIGFAGLGKRRFIK